MTSTKNIKVQDVNMEEVVNATSNEEVEATANAKKKNFIKKLIDKHQDKRDTEIEFLASMDREARHTYIKKKRIRRAKKIAIGTAIVLVAYLLGRAKNGDFEDTSISNEDLDNLLKDMGIDEGEKGIIAVSRDPDPISITNDELSEMLDDMGIVVEDSEEEEIDNTSEDVDSEDTNSPVDALSEALDDSDVVVEEL